MRTRSRVPFYLAVSLLIVAGIALAIWRHIELGIPWLTGEQRPVWMIEARVDFQANGEPVLASPEYSGSTSRIFHSLRAGGIARLRLLDHRESG